MQELELQKKRFYQLVSPSSPNEWEVEDVFEGLTELESGQWQYLLEYVEAIWPVSHALCFAYLQQGAEIVRLLSPENLGDWVRKILELYEAEGLVGARRFMAHIESNFLVPRVDSSATPFEQVVNPMLHYVRGVSGRGFELQKALVPFTDTEIIYLPPVIDVFSSKAENRLMYKLIVSLQWAQVQSGLFSQITDDTVGVGGGGTPVADESKYEEKLLGDFGDTVLAKDLLSILLFVVGFSFLKKELPGLVRQSQVLCSRILHGAGLKNNKSMRGEVLQRFLHRAVEDAPVVQNSVLPGEFDILLRVEDERVDVPGVLAQLYDYVEKVKGSYDLSGLYLLLGTFDCKAAVRNVVKKRDRDKKRFVALLHETAGRESRGEGEKPHDSSLAEQIYDTLLVMLEGRDEEVKKRSDNGFFRLENEGVDIPEELLALAAEIQRDLGYLPEAYIQAAAGVGGGGYYRGDGGGEDGEENSRKNFVPSGIVYDEWDYRRGGYRKGWCSLYEKSVSPVMSDFVGKTLEKYRPQLIRLRRQFEMLRTSERFVRRRRHGDEIDLDALIDALGDSRAGLCPSDRLFVRLLRDERDISTLFLVDMSNSTEGWVGLAIREALVLLAESLEVVGDPYGIYGFSGMRRSKNEVYHIKHIDEPYCAEVQQRVAAMKPMEYTRMGPPIRHLTEKLQDVSSKVRLLIVLSDGKPEDYDEYKGTYAIEDTKKALLEAQGQGVRPFCITIDRAAQEYLAHMFGARNYVFINDIFSLPGRMAEMYRMLTS